MLASPKNIETVIFKRNSTVELLIAINVITVLILTFLFLILFGIDFRVQHFLFSYRLVLLPIIIVVQFIIFQRIFIVLVLGFFALTGKRVSKEKPEEKFGKYTAAEILEIVSEQCKKMGVTSVKRVYVMESSVSNALTTDIFLFKPFRYSVLVLFSNVFEIMNREELSAIIGHEVAHVRNYDSWFLGLVGNPTLMMLFVLIILLESVPVWSFYPEVILTIFTVLIIFYILLRPVVKRMLRYCEYFADYTSAKVNGLIPMTNSLVKLGQRAETLVAFQQEFQRRFRLDGKVPDKSKFFERLREDLKSVIDPDEAIKVARRLVKEFGGDERTYVKPAPKGSVFFKPIVIDWREYDKHIRNYSLDYVELDQFVAALKDSPQARLFEHASPNRFVALFQTHPRFRDRIVFLWDTQKDKHELITYDVPVFSAMKDIEEYIDKKFICPICQTQFNLKKDPKASAEVKCPWCGIPGEIQARI
ncbi:M48 family metallopeptidase [[Eubacterium] cellulosolvens]